jgi:PilZ domain
MKRPESAVADGEHAELLALIENQFRGGTTAEPVDQRQNERRPFTGLVTIQPCDSRGMILATPLEGQAIDISLWGLQFSTDKRLDVGQFLALGFQVRLLGQQRTALMLSEVRHVQARKPKGWTIGCAFRETLCSNEAL